MSVCYTYFMGKCWCCCWCWCLCLWWFWCWCCCWYFRYFGLIDIQNSGFLHRFLHTLFRFGFIYYILIQSTDTFNNAFSLFASYSSTWFVYMYAVHKYESLVSRFLVWILLLLFLLCTSLSRYHCVYRSCYNWNNQQTFYNRSVWNSYTSKWIMQHVLYMCLARKLKPTNLIISIL